MMNDFYQCNIIVCIYYTVRAGFGFLLRENILYKDATKKNLPAAERFVSQAGKVCVIM